MLVDVKECVYVDIPHTLVRYIGTLWDSVGQEHPTSMRRWTSASASASARASERMIRIFHVLVGVEHQETVLFKSFQRRLFSARTLAFDRRHQSTDLSGPIPCDPTWDQYLGPILCEEQKSPLVINQIIGQLRSVNGQLIRRYAVDAGLGSSS